MSKVHLDLPVRSAEGKKKPRCRPFKAGNTVGKGRPKGSRNKTSALVKMQLAEHAGRTHRTADSISKERTPRRFEAGHKHTVSHPVGRASDLDHASRQRRRRLGASLLCPTGSRDERRTDPASKLRTSNPSWTACSSPSKTRWGRPSNTSSNGTLSSRGANVRRDLQNRLLPLTLRTRSLSPLMRYFCVFLTQST